MTEQSDFLSFHNFFLIFFAAFVYVLSEFHNFYRSDVVIHLRWVRRKSIQMHLKLKKTIIFYRKFSNFFPFLLHKNKIETVKRVDERSFWDVAPTTVFRDVTQWEFSHYRYLLSLPAFFRAYTRQSRGEQQRKKKKIHRVPALCIP